MIKHLYLLGLLFAVVFTEAQSTTIQGKLYDDAKSPLEAASVFLLNSDSTFNQGTATNERGDFILVDVLLNKTYVLKVVSMGYHPLFQRIVVQTSAVNLGIIYLTSKASDLKQVTVEGKIPVATINGDTTSYSANAYKVNKDANAEDLVTKMPGVVVVDGKVQAQGEEVKQVLVDGKVFFGDDANAVLKNIPAEVIDKIQVFDKKSEQTQLTGFDDGNTTKTINIVTKPQFRNGTFGKVYAGYGYQDKYKSGGSVNIFKENRRITILALSNNVNEQNFSSDDLAGVMSSTGGGQGGGGRGRGGMRGGAGGQGGSNTNNADNFLINAQNGIITSTAFGLNYSDKWGSKTEVTSSYFFNTSQNKINASLKQQYVLGSYNGLTYDETSNSINNNLNHRFNIKIETKIDSHNSIVFQPKFSFQFNNGNKLLLGQTIRSGSLLSSTNNDASNKVFSYAIATPILFRHAFEKRGRTFSVNLVPNFSKNNTDNTLNTRNLYYSDTIALGDTVDQEATLFKTGNGLSGSIVYTEPISKTKFLSFNYSSSYSENYSSKKTFNKDLNAETYTLVDSMLSNEFKSQYQTQSGGLGFRYQKEKLNISINATYQWASLQKEQEFPSAFTLGKTFHSFLPSAQLQYKITPQKTLRINYRSSNNAPGIDQLQEVINNTNSLQLSTGNPDLKQDLQQNLNIRYSKVDTKKANSFFALLSGSYNFNYIGNSSIIALRDTMVYNDVVLPSGSQISRPVNLDGFYSLRSFVNYTFPLKKIKTNFSVNASVGYNHIPGLINEVTNFANTSTGGLGLVLSSNISPKVDFTISSNANYSDIRNTLQSTAQNNYYSQFSKIKIIITPIKSIVFQSEYTHTLYTGLSSAFNQSISLWNAGIGYKFLKNLQGELRITVYDLLNQNNSIQRTNTESYTQDLQTNVLNRYYLLTFTYNFRKKYTPPNK